MKREIFNGKISEQESTPAFLNIKEDKFITIYQGCKLVKDETVEVFVDYFMKNKFNIHVVGDGTVTNLPEGDKTITEYKTFEEFCKANAKMSDTSTDVVVFTEMEYNPENVKQLIKFADKGFFLISKREAITPFEEVNGNFYVKIIGSDESPMFNVIVKGDIETFGNQNADKPKVSFNEQWKF